MKKTNNPLGSLWKEYVEGSEYNKAERGGILLDIHKQTLEFYPVNNTDEKTQLILQQVCQEINNPSSKHNHTITVSPNEGYKDLELYFTLKGFESRKIGYVPSRITRLLKKNLSMLSSGTIIKSFENQWEKYYQVKVMFNWSNSELSIKKRKGRFALMANDI